MAGALWTYQGIDLVNLSLRGKMTVKFYKLIKYNSSPYRRRKAVPAGSVFAKGYAGQEDASSQLMVSARKW
jgi:hypothetical protein